MIEEFVLALLKIIGTMVGVFVIIGIFMLLMYGIAVLADHVFRRIRGKKHG